MVAIKKKQILDVSMNGSFVGQLERISAMGLKFRYTESWLEMEGARPISLSLPLSANAYDDDRVFFFFDNLLPDNPKIRARIQARFHAKTDQPFDLLASIGKDCVGAIQFSSETIKDIKKIEAEPLNNHEIANLLKNYREAPLGMTKESDDFRISIAGAQEKSALLYHGKQWCRPLSTTPTSHIFKLSIGMLEHQQMDLSMSCENEWLCLQIAKAFGLDTASSAIEKFEDVKVLVVERFDRQLAQDGSWIMRLPQEDLCQALGYSPNLKYQSDGGPGIKNIMKFLLDSTNPNSDRDNFFRTQILFWLLAAIDGHAKNFSVFIKPYGRYQSTPLYDIMSAHPLLANKQLQKQKIKMAMALTGKNKHYKWYMGQCRHFISTAKAANYSPKRAEELLNEMLEKVDSVVSALSNNLPDDFPNYISGPIFEGMIAMRDRLLESA